MLGELSSRGGWNMPANVTIRANSRETLSIVYGDNEYKIGTGNYPRKAPETV